MITSMSEFVAETDPLARGLSLLVMMLVLVAAVILVIMLVAWGRRMATAKGKPKRPTPPVDAWEEAGRRASPPPSPKEDRDEPPR